MCNNSCGCGGIDFWWIIILLIILYSCGGSFGCGCGCNSCGCGGCNSCN